MFNVHNCLHIKRLSHLTYNDLIENAVNKDYRVIIIGFFLSEALRNPDIAIKKIEEMEQRREQDFKQSKIFAQPDIDIHRIIAEASENEVLIILWKIISNLGQQSDLFDYMRSKSYRPHISHRKIIEALKERNPDKAERYMVAHIDKLMSDVHVYYQEFIDKHNELID